MRVVRGVRLIIFLTLGVAVVVVAMDCSLSDRVLTELMLLDDLFTEEEWEIELACPGGASDEFLTEVLDNVGFKIDPGVVD
jgi:hypothetical protein